jgi:excisionase family DNA binding protein
VAVRTGKDRRVGGGSEKLLTLEEAARRLHLPADDVEAMIRRGGLSSFRLGGTLLRVRAGDIDALQRECRPQGTFWERLVDFFYFNDFYILLLLLLLTLLTIIFSL